MDDVLQMNPLWYVVYTYTGYESIVKDSLEKLIEKNGLEERILEIQIPMEDVIEEKNGKRKVVQRKKFPCYVMLKMRYTNDMWHLITDTRGVISFVGPQGKPLPLTEDEIRRMHLETVKVEVDYVVGDSVKVIEGPLEGFIGSIIELDINGNKCRVNVSMFGRITPVELDLIQISRMD
ncbi:MAG: transcription termination/antitermination protein NusG [Clostridiales bacterium]|jgi:transcriptional antiterminator NusG|nr:transcription termination/antitermination protein NusG [Clostridiales bacterium]